MFNHRIIKLSITYFFPRQTANVNLYLMTKFPDTKIGRFTPILSLRIVLSYFYQLVSHFDNFFDIFLPFAVNAMLNLSNLFFLVRLVRDTFEYFSAFKG